MGSSGVKVSQLLAQGGSTPANPKLAYHDSNSSSASEPDMEKANMKGPGSISAQDKDWMSSGFGQSGSGFYKSSGTTRTGGVAGFNQQPLTMERPMTASSMNNKTRELENQLKEEQRTKKRLVDEVESLKKELHK